MSIFTRLVRQLINYTDVKRFIQEEVTEEIDDLLFEVLKKKYPEITERQIQHFINFINGRVNAWRK